MATVAYPHIEIDTAGMPVFAGTQFKILHIILDRIAYHWDADEIQRQHPTLTLAQIYSALAYYHDHQEEMDRDIEDRLHNADDLLGKQLESPVKWKLKAARSAR